MSARQRPVSTSALEIDDRAGYYGNLVWRPNPAATLNLFAYDNEGSKTGVTAGHEWAWATRFAEAGASVRLNPQTLVRVQAIHGETVMGYSSTEGIWVDDVFSSAYVAVTRDIGRTSLTGRLDSFRVTDKSTRTLDNNDENGWSAEAALRQDVGHGVNVVLEVLYVDSTRPSRPVAREDQTVVQTAVRWRF
jgi:hypothetical protein